MDKASKFWVVFSAAIFLATASFGYGLVVSKYQIFPYDQINDVYRLIGGKSDLSPRSKSKQTQTSSIDSIFFALDRRIIPTAETFVGKGGGLAKLDDVIIGVDAAGKFFYFDGESMLPLSIDVELNRQLAFEHIDENVEDATVNRVMKSHFRAHGIVLRKTPNSVDVYMAHNYWLPERLAKVTRLSRLVLSDLNGLISGDMHFGADDWEVLYECKPAMDFVTFRRSPFANNQSGGQLAVGPDGGIYVSFGDVLLDGIENPLMASQDDSTCFGKIMRFDPDSGQMQEFARGLRNPMGLTFDTEGRLWASDSGPRGGDELDLIVAGENYGWPLNTYGVDYGARTWPLSVKQGRHEQYKDPVYAWLPSVAPSALIQIGDLPAEWSGDLLMGTLAGASLHRLRVIDERVVFDEPIRIGERIRDLLQQDDGSFLLWTDKPHLIELRVASHGNAVNLPVALSEREKESDLGGVLAVCASCHVMNDGPGNLKAPVLWGVYGRAIASTDFENYSDALGSREGHWNTESLAQFISDPQSFAPGTTMGEVPPMSDEARSLLIDYLERMH